MQYAICFKAPVLSGENQALNPNPVTFNLWDLMTSGSSSAKKWKEIISVSLDCHQK